ncbi:hypothetical protein [Pollutimonas bauzanensis]|uniref:hypothetical protein n=1 Tax=Pollutimonas bauzanensis TaxID=658167 RepID=UPI00333E9AFE
MNRIATILANAVSGAGLIVLVGCTPMLAGQMAEAGYNAAKSSLGGTSDATTGASERQKLLQSTLNSVEIGQEVKPILELMGEPPKEKSGNADGFTCYEYASVYSATEAAVIMSKDGKVVFYGNSRCSVEMQDANFKKDGKYMVGDTGH